MTDPAVEAAERAWDVEEPDHSGIFPYVDESDLMVAAAREALAPIRDTLHEAIEVASASVGLLNLDEVLDIMADALIAVRPLIYPESELT